MEGTTQRKEIRKREFNRPTYNPVKGRKFLYSTCGGGGGGGFISPLSKARTLALIDIFPSSAGGEGDSRIGSFLVL